MSAYLLGLTLYSIIVLLLLLLLLVVVVNSRFHCGWNTITSNYGDWVGGQRERMMKPAIKNPFNFLTQNHSKLNYFPL